MGSHVAICIPSGEMVHADFMLSLIHLVQQTRVSGHRVSVVNSKSSLITQGRNLAVNAALEARAEWLLFLDSDMTFPADTVSRLLAHQQPLVGATYPRKGLPLGFIGNRPDGSAFSLQEAGLIEAGRLPTGCLLIRSSVFASLKAPFFRCSYDEESGEVLSEDFWFSERVRSLGFQLWCDLDLSRLIAHLGIYRYAMKGAPQG